MSQVQVQAEKAAETELPDSEKRSGLLGYLLLLPAVAWLAMFFLVPLFSLVNTSLLDPAGSLETGYEMTWQFSNYTGVWQDYSEQFLRSMAYAGLATVTCILLGYPLAYAIAFKAGRWKNLMLVAVIAPFFTSFLIRTISWQLILSDQGFVVETLKYLHILGADGHLLATPFAVVTGLTYNFLPFMVLPLYASLEKIDPRLLEAGEDLYASPFTTFRTVTLRLSLPGLVGGTLLTFIPAAGDYINAQLLGNTQTQMVGNVIQKLYDGGSYPDASALSVTLMAVIVVLVFVLRTPGRHRGAALMRVGKWVERAPDPRHRHAGAALHVHPDLHRHRDVVQRTGQPQQLRLQRVHPAQLDAPLRAARHVRLRGAVHPDRTAGDAAGDDPGHADGVRARAAPLPRPVGGQRVHVPADGLARDRDGLLAAGTVREPPASRASWASRPS